MRIHSEKHSNSLKNIANSCFRKLISVYMNPSKFSESRQSLNCLLNIIVNDFQSEILQYHYLSF